MQTRKKIKIIAIGGGEIGRPGTKIETETIDKEIIKLTGKKNPKLLLIPTASNDSEMYYPVVQKYFGKRLGCRTDVLYLIKAKPSKKEIEKKIYNTDIVYVGGGNTLRMLKIWRRTGVDEILKKAAKKGIVLSGVSAGAICWFKYGLSDSLRFHNAKNKKLIQIKGLGLVDAMACPHYNFEKNRKPALLKMIREKGGIAIALENCSALEITGDNLRIIISRKGARAYKVYKKNGEVCEEELFIDNKFKPIKNLYSDQLARKSGFN